MSALERAAIDRFDLQGARRAILRYQPASNWVSVSRDPTQRMTIGLGFDVSRRDAPEMMRQVGLDPAAVRAGRMPISDAQMDELFDLALVGAVDCARQRVPEFDEMPPERQWALLELIVWLGPDGADAAFGELGRLALPLTDEPPEPSPWFDTPRRRRSTPRSGRAARPEPLRLAFESFGLVAELASDDADLFRAAQAMLPPGWRAADGRPDVRFGLWSNRVITVNGRRADRAADREESLLKLGGAIRHHLATDAPGFTFVHAGVVDVGGRAIVIPGRSYTGKSTLVAELVRLGARYLSDEYAVLDADGLVHPFAKPLSIRRGRRDPLGRLVPVSQELIAEEAVRAGLVVLTAYAPGACWQPSVRSRADGAFALLQNTVSARLRPDRALSATSRLAREAVFVAGQRGEASQTARALLETALLQTGSSARLPA